MSTVNGSWDQLRSAVHMCYVHPAIVAPPLLERLCESWLSQAEREHRQRLRIERVRREYTITRLLCRSVLGRYTGVEPAGWVFEANAHGKPAIAQPTGLAELRFNLTHCQGLIACAVTRAGEIGVDAEELCRAASIQEVERYFLSEEERAVVRALPVEKRGAWMVEAWVLKEAYLKGLGVGISREPAGITVARDPARAAEGCHWELSLHWPTGAHVAATAVRPEALGLAGHMQVEWRDAAALLME